MIEFSDEEELETVPEAVYPSGVKCQLLGSLRHRELGIRRRHKGHPINYNHLLATKLHVQPIETDKKSIGKSIAVFDPTGDLLAVGDSRPSITIYEFDESDLAQKDDGSTENLPRVTPTVLLGTGAFQSDSVTSICWLRDDKIAISMAFDPDVKVYG